jgi:hypothetical protein
MFLRKTPFYADRERAAQEWTDALTLISQTHGPDDVYERGPAQLSDKEIVDLTSAIAMLNGMKLAPDQSRSRRRNPRLQAIHALLVSDRRRSFSLCYSVGPQNLGVFGDQCGGSEQISESCGWERS